MNGAIFSVVLSPIPVKANVQLWVCRMKCSDKFIQADDKVAQLFVEPFRQSRFPGSGRPNNNYIFHGIPHGDSLKKAAWSKPPACENCKIKWAVERITS